MGTSFRFYGSKKKKKKKKKKKMNVQFRKLIKFKFRKFRVNNSECLSITVTEVKGIQNGPLIFFFVLRMVYFDMQNQNLLFLSAITGNPLIRKDIFRIMEVFQNTLCIRYSQQSRGKKILWIKEFSGHDRRKWTADLNFAG